MIDIALFSKNIWIAINESENYRRIIPTSKIVKSDFYVIDIPPIAEGLDSAQGGSEGTGGGEDFAPRIVNIFYHFGAGAVNQTDNIALEIMNVSILRAIELHNSGAVLGVIASFVLGPASPSSKLPTKCIKNRSLCTWLLNEGIATSIQMCSIIPNVFKHLMVCVSSEGGHSCSPVFDTILGNKGVAR